MSSDLSERPRRPCGSRLDDPPEERAFSFGPSVAAQPQGDERLHSATGSMRTGRAPSAEAITRHSSRLAIRPRRQDRAGQGGYQQMTPAGIGL
jgi:hypothetical protein